MPTKNKIEEYRDNERIMFFKSQIIIIPKICTNIMDMSETKLKNIPAVANFKYLSLKPSWVKYE